MNRLSVSLPTRPFYVILLYNKSRYNKPRRAANIFKFAARRRPLRRFNDNLLQRFISAIYFKDSLRQFTSTIHFVNLLQRFASAICFNDSFRQFTSARISRRVRRKNSRNRTERRRTRSSLLSQPFCRCRATLPRQFSYLF